jgi:hypothetical protein
MYLISPTSSVSLGSFSDARRKSLNDRFLPEAEVNLGVLNVGFGGAVYQSVTESEAAYIDRGG